MILTVGNITSRLDGVFESKLLYALDWAMSFPIDGAVFSEKYRAMWCPRCRRKCVPLPGASYTVSIRKAKGPMSCIYHGTVEPVSLWDGRQHLFSVGTRRFPTGLIHYCRQVLNDHKIVYKVVDEREKFPVKDEIKLTGITLRDYQNDAIKKALTCQRGIIQAATGAGKTEIFTGIVGGLNMPTVVYTHRSTILHQTRDRMEKRLGVDVGLVGDGEKIIKPITVAMIQTVADTKKRDIYEMAVNARCAIFDECHHISAPSIYTIHKISKNAFYRIGVSATPWRDDGSDMMIEAATAKKIVQISATELIDMGVLAKPKIYFLKSHTVTAEDSVLSYPSIYKRCITENELRNSTISYLCNFLFRKGKTVLIAVNQIEHGRRILQTLREKYPMIRSIFIQGENETEEKKQALIDLDKHEIDVCVATTVFGEGVDVPHLDALINCKAAQSSVDTFQLVGRVLRSTASKKTCTVIDFYDEGKYLERHSKARLKILKTEPGYKIKMVGNVDDLLEDLTKDFEGV